MKKMLLLSAALCTAVSVMGAASDCADCCKAKNACPMPPPQCQMKQDRMGHRKGPADHAKFMEMKRQRMAKFAEEFGAEKAAAFEQMNKDFREAVKAYRNDPSDLNKSALKEKFAPLFAMRKEIEITMLEKRLAKVKEESGNIDAAFDKEIERINHRPRHHGKPGPQFGTENCPPPAAPAPAPAPAPEAPAAPAAPTAPAPAPAAE